MPASHKSPQQMTWFTFHKLLQGLTKTWYLYFPKILRANGQYPNNSGQKTCKIPKKSQKLIIICRANVNLWSHTRSSFSRTKFFSFLKRCYYFNVSFSQNISINRIVNASKQIELYMHHKQWNKKNKCFFKSLDDKVERKIWLFAFLFAFICLIFFYNSFMI